MIQRFPFRVSAAALIAAGVAPMAPKCWLLSDAGCAEKRALESGAPCRCALCNINCNLLEIYVIYEHAAHPSVPLLRENNKPPHFLPRTNPQSTQKTQNTNA
jgi:hypothetical protein